VQSGAVGTDKSWVCGDCGSPRPPSGLQMICVWAVVLRGAGAVAARQPARAAEAVREHQLTSRQSAQPRRAGCSRRPIRCGARVLADPLALPRHRGRQFSAARSSLSDGGNRLRGCW